MPIFIYNSLTRKKEEFIPLNPPRVNIYTCGVTVYDESHIGHARSLYIFDLVRRYLEFCKFKVRFVRNITDIDDKIINRANELKISWKELAGKYIKRYYEDIKSLKIRKGDYEPRATASIPKMIKYILKLIEKGYAYQAGNDVYFNVRKFNDYGKLSGQAIEEMRSAKRIGPNELKRDSLDFVLWKGSKDNEPYWHSPFGPGRPGWHIECSVMSQAFLKSETLDIHAGGRDLIFPHHENEIAQSESFTGKPFAKYWIHHGLLTMNGQKMSKSSGNFITIKDFILKYSDSDLLKIFFLFTHYSHPVDYTEEKILEARSAKERILTFLNKTKPSFRQKYLSFRKEHNKLNKIRDKFIEKLNDDFNTPEAFSCLFEAVNIGNKNIEDRGFAVEAYFLVLEMAKILGLSLRPLRKEIKVSDREVMVKIRLRDVARKDKDYVLADKIRKELEGEGVILEDLKNGSTIWRRV
jgi:cysteinyl-tRNA synthetase